MAAIRRYHVQHNGWRDAGYHFGIRKSGRLELGRPLVQAGAHTTGANDTIGLCVYGNGDTEAWTLAQWDTVLAFCVEWCQRFNWSAEDIHGHREAPARLGAKPTGKTCPGRLVDMDQVRARVAAALTRPAPVCSRGP
jgi:hypothetical protein